MPDEYTFKFEVEVTINPHKWASEYVVNHPVEDAREYLPELLEDGLSRQKSWGTITDVTITTIGDSE